jgi:hypothetical protein
VAEIERLAPERLASSWAKLNRAEAHVNKFRAAVVAASDGKSPPRVLSTTRKFDPESERVLFIAERLPEIGDDWGLMVGDAIHNLRCALDHLWWQLAIDELGREPTEDEAKSIQFPIISDPDSWDGHRFLQHVGTDAADKAKTFQGYDRPEGPTLLSVLGALRDWSNTDKHRELPPSFFESAGFTWAAAPPPQMLTDCKIPSRPDSETGEPIWEMDVEFGPVGHPGRVEVGDVVLGVRVVPTGKNPDIDQEPEIALDIFFGERETGYNVQLLDHIGSFVFRILNEFAPLLKPPS